MRAVSGDLHEDPTGGLGDFTSHFDQHSPPGGDMSFAQRVLAAAVGVVPATLGTGKRLDRQGRIGHGHTVTAIRVVPGGELGGISHEV